MEKESLSPCENSQTEENKIKEGQNPRLQRFSAFFERNFAIFFVPIIVMFVYICALWRYDVYPFGDKYTAASYDLSAQICPFIEHLYDVFEGKSTLTYSYAIAGGADVTGTFLYFFISPFSFLFLVFGEGRVAHASSIVMLFKLATIAVSGTWFAKKMFQGIPDYLCIAIGGAYAYCGYTFVANTYINWMDFLIYLPFCVGAFRHFVKTGKFLPFSILMACCVYTCFSIACFAMLTVYPTLIGYAIFCVKKEERKKFIAYLSLSFVVTLLICLPILFPALVATMTGARSDGLFDKLWYGYVDGKFDKKNFLDAFSKAMYAKWTYIFTDSIFVVLTLVWFYRKGFKEGFSRFMLLAGILTLLPLLVDESMKLLNMGSYYSYALRFGFLNALYFLGGACLCLENLCYKPRHSYDGKPLYEGAAENASLEASEEGKTPEEENAPAVCVKEEGEEVKQSVSPSVSIKETVGETGVEIGLTPCENACEKVSEKTSQEENEGGRYALNKNSVLPNAKGKKPHAYCVASILFIVLGVLATAIFATMLIAADAFARMEYSKYLDLVAKIVAKFPASWKEGIETTCNTLRTMDGSFAHSLGNMETIGIVFIIVFIVAAVGCLLVSYKKISVRLLSYVLIAVVGAQVLFFNGQLVIGNTSTQYKTLDTFTAAVDRLTAMDDSYYRIKDFGDKNDKDEVKETLMGNAPLVSGANSYSVFSSVIAKENFIIYPLMWPSSSNATNSLKSLGRSKSFMDAFLGYKYYWVPNEKDDKKTADDLSYLTPVYTGEKDKDGKDIPFKEGNFLLYENEIVFPNAYVVQEGGFTFAAPNDKERENRIANQKALYEFLGGKEYDEKEFPGIAKTRTLSKKLHAENERRGLEMKVGAGEITVNVTADKEGECLFLNFVASKGYSVTVNGEKAELVENDLQFLSVALEKGENRVVFRYSSPSVKYMGVGVLVAALGLCAVALVLKKTKWMDACSSVIAYAGVILAGGVVAFFMVYPTGVFLVKLIELLRLLL